MVKARSLQDLAGIKKTLSDEAAKKAIANIIACPWSGIVFKFQDNYEERIKLYFDKALELRELYRPLSCGRGDLDKKKDVKK